MSRKTKILILLANMLVIPAIAFAENDSYSIIASVLNAILSALSWFGYAIALGILIWIGIKYMLSGANERANLKGTASMYLIGVALIVLCSTIAGGVAEIAGKSGDNTASGIVDKGFKLGGITVTGGGKEDISSDDTQKEFTEEEKDIVDAVVDNINAANNGKVEGEYGNTALPVWSFAEEWYTGEIKSTYILPDEQTALQLTYSQYDEYNRVTVIEQTCGNTVKNENGMVLDGVRYDISYYDTDGGTVMKIDVSSIHFDRNHAERYDVYLNADGEVNEVIYYETDNKETDPLDFVDGIIIKD